MCDGQCRRDMAVAAAPVDRAYVGPMPVTLLTHRVCLISRDQI